MKNAKIWFKRMGMIGFLFFLIKGLVWLAILLGIGSLFTR
jgi:hypothetical protein